MTNDNLEEVLSNGGFIVIGGYVAVKDAIKKISSGKEEKLCSGYKVFPDGSKCEGCRDCGGKP